MATPSNLKGPPHYIGTAAMDPAERPFMFAAKIEKMVSDLHSLHEAKIAEPFSGPALLSGRAHQGKMALVQRAHGGNQAKPLVSTFRSAARGAHLFNRLEDFHRPLFGLDEAA